MHLPVADTTFDAATIAFGIRNVADPLAGCRELHRVLVPGGRAAILEFGMPTMPGVAGLYAWYFRAVLPRVGRLISRHADAYDYLPASVSAFPSGESFVTILPPSRVFVGALRPIGPWRRLSLCRRAREDAGRLADILSEHGFMYLDLKTTGLIRLTCRSPSLCARPYWHRSWHMR